MRSTVAVILVSVAVFPAFLPESCSTRETPTAPTRSTTTSTTTTTSASCSLSFTGAGCIQLQVDASNAARSLTAATYYDLYVARGSDPASSQFLCRWPRTLCFGPGCDGAGTRSIGADVSLLPPIAGARLTLTRQGSRTAIREWTVDLNRCFNQVSF